MLFSKAMASRKWFRFLLALAILGFSAPWLWAGDTSVDLSGETEIVVTHRVELCADPKDNPDTPEKEGPTTEDLQNFIEAHQANVTQIWNACPHRLRVWRGTPAKTVRFVFEFSIVEDCKSPLDPDKKRFRVHPGLPPEETGKNADSENLWLENTDRTLAHEFGHSMGLEDEYSYNGGTRENLMGRGTGGDFEKVERYHVTTILFNNVGDPDPAEQRRRAFMESMLRMKDQTTARRAAADNGIPKADYDAYKDQFTVNNSQVQPGRPE